MLDLLKLKSDLVSRFKELFLRQNTASVNFVGSAESSLSFFSRNGATSGSQKTELNTSHNKP